MSLRSPCVDVGARLIALRSLDAASAVREEQNKTDLKPNLSAPTETVIG